jgi:hypothetical protein
VVVQEVQPEKSTHLAETALQAASQEATIVVVMVAQSTPAAVMQAMGRMESQAATLTLATAAVTSPQATRAVTSLPASLVEVSTPALVAAVSTPVMAAAALAPEAQAASA